jgi:hypothetical protein
MTDPDLTCHTDRSFLHVCPSSARGVDWLLQHTAWDTLEGVLLCEHRYGPDLLCGAYGDGLAISLDGRMADAERRAP